MYASMCVGGWAYVRVHRYICVCVCVPTINNSNHFLIPEGGGGEVDSWEDIAADDTKPTETSNTQQPLTVTQVTSTTSEPATTSNTITEPSIKETSIPSNQKEADDTPPGADVTVKTNETQAAGASNKKDNDLEPELKAKVEQTSQSSPSATPVPKTKVIAAPQRAENDKENVNIVFIGHVDAGKSTIGGHVMLVSYCIAHVVGSHSSKFCHN